MVLCGGNRLTSFWCVVLGLPKFPAPSYRYEAWPGPKVTHQEPTESTEASKQKWVGSNLVAPVPVSYITLSWGSQKKKTQKTTKNSKNKNENDVKCSSLNSAEKNQWNRTAWLAVNVNYPGLAKKWKCVGSNLRHRAVFKSACVGHKNAREVGQLELWKKLVSTKVVMRLKFYFELKDAATLQEDGGYFEEILTPLLEQYIYKQLAKLRTTFSYFCN